MRRFAFVFLLMLVFTSCNATVKQPEYPIEYGGKVYVNYDGTDFHADIVYSSGSMHITLVEPVQLYGTSIEFIKDEIKVWTDSLELTYRYVSSEKIFPLRFAFEALEYLNTEKPEFVLKDNLIYTQFSVENEICEVFLKKDSCKLVTVKYNGFSFDFH